MRLGLIARADNSGLGMQTWEFYKHMKPVKTLLMDISGLNGNKIFPERYPDAVIVRDILRAGDIDDFLDGLDVVFVAEAPYNYHLYARAKELGVKVAVQYNYEFFDWFAYPHYPTPDMLIAPSKWHYNNVELFAEVNNIKHVYLHCPVNREVLPFREIRHARTFLHVAGRSAAHDRNGTKTVIAAAKYLKTPAQILIHFQGEQGLAHQTTMTTSEYRKLVDELAGKVQEAGGNLSMVTHEFENYADVYAMGDVLLMPRRYGGNCMPVNEALSVGMPTIMTDIAPNNDFLPHRWLIPAAKIDEFTPRTKIDIYGSNPEHLARKIDRFYNMDETEMLTQNAQASNLAETISWENMAWKYTEALESLCA